MRGVARSVLVGEYDWGARSAECRARVRLSQLDGNLVGGVQSKRARVYGDSDAYDESRVQEAKSHCHTGPFLLTMEYDQQLFSLETDIPITRHLSRSIDVTAAETFLVVFRSIHWVFSSRFGRKEKSRKLLPILKCAKAITILYV